MYGNQTDTNYLIIHSGKIHRNNWKFLIKTNIKLHYDWKQKKKNSSFVMLYTSSHRSYWATVGRIDQHNHRNKCFCTQKTLNEMSSCGMHFLDSTEKYRVLEELRRPLATLLFVMIIRHTSCYADSLTIVTPQYQNLLTYRSLVRNFSVKIIILLI